MSSTETNIIENPENVYLNPFEPLFVKTIEEIVDEEKNERLKEMSEKANKENIKKDISSKTLNDISTEMSDNLLDLFDDFFKKPQKTSWIDYLQVILSKGNRLMYIGVLLIVISIIITFVNK